MNSLNSFQALISAICLIGLTACGGGGSSSDPSTNSATSPGGIWTGTDSVTGLGITALISESGQMDVIRQDRAQFFGALTVRGSSISATIDGDAAFGTTFPDGSIHGTGQVDGTLSPRDSIQATVQFTTDNGESSTSDITLTFQQGYIASPPNIVRVADIAGTYEDSFTGATVTIYSDGTIFSQDANTGCVINGSISVPNSTYDLLSVTLTYASCQGNTAALNGLQFSGLATFDMTNIAGLQDQSGKHYGVVFELTEF